MISQGAKLLAFRDTQKHCQKAILWQGFPNGKPLKIKAVQSQNLCEAFQVFSEILKEQRKANNFCVISQPCLTTSSLVKYYLLGFSQKDYHR